MLDCPPPTPAELDRDHVEPVHIARTAVSLGPSRRHPGDPLPLAPPDGLDPGPEAPRGTGLHLDEGHETAPPDDQVHVVSAQPEPVGFDLPPRRREPLECHGLTRKPQPVPGIG